MTQCKYDNYVCSTTDSCISNSMGDCTYDMGDGIEEHELLTGGSLPETIPC